MLREFASDFFGGIPADLDPFFSGSSNSEASNRTNSPTIDDDFVVELDSTPDGGAYHIIESEKTVIIDPEHGEWDAGKDDLREFWEEHGRAFSESAFELYLSIKSSESDVDAVCSFFEPPVLSDGQFAMLKQAYHLSIYFDTFPVTKDEKDRRREQLADDFGSSAMNVPSLCSAGYLNEDSAFREAYEQLSDRDSQEEEYQALFSQLIQGRPFVVFVKGRGGDKTSTEIYDLVLQKSRRLDDLTVDLDYIHIRGIGKHAREKIRKAKEMLEDHHDGINIFVHNTERQEGSREMVVVVDNDTI